MSKNGTTRPAPGQNRQLRAAWLGLAPLLVPGLLLAQAPNPAPVKVVAEGALGRALFGGDFGKASGLKLGGWIEAGYVLNDDVHGSQGLGNSPVILNRDTGLQLNQAYLFLEKEIKTNLIPRVTPTPAPMSQDYSFGWHVDLMYGRDAQPLQVYGWDSRLAVNQPGNYDPAKAQQDKQNFLVAPQVYVQGYLPWYKGMAFLLGIWQAPGSYEIGFHPGPGPNFFYSHTYAMEAAVIKEAGLLWCANLVKDKAFGLLSTEVAITNGWSNLKDNNRNPAFNFNLRYRTSDMRTWVDFLSMTGNAQADAALIGFPQNAGNRWFGDSANIPTTRLISPRGQLKTEEELILVREVGANFKLVVEGSYGRQRGDGAPDTIDIVTGPGFKGAQWGGLNLEAQYRFSPRLAWAIRAETFRDRDGFILFPNATARSDYNALTTGVQWHPTPYLEFRPELRYDWQADNAGQDAYANGTRSRQLGFNVDGVFRF